MSGDAWYTVALGSGEDLWEFRARMRRSQRTGSRPVSTQAGSGDKHIASSFAASGDTSGASVLSVLAVMRALPD